MLIQNKIVFLFSSTFVERCSDLGGDSAFNIIYPTFLTESPPSPPSRDLREVIFKPSSTKTGYNYGFIV